MPWRSVQQQKWGHSPEGVQALGGPAKVQEWDQATKALPGGFKSLPTKQVRRSPLTALARLAGRRA